MNNEVSIRFAAVEDTPLILQFIRGLAAYEKLSDECFATEASLKATLFGEQKSAEVLLAHWHGEAAGFALFFHNYSTFLAKPGIYLEDLFVDPNLRGKGIGKALLQHLARIAVQRGCGRLEWSVLDWNKDAIDFYRSLGAKAMEEWTVNRVTGAELIALAK